MPSAIKAAIAIVATVASISSWAGGHLELSPDGIKVVLFSQHVPATQNGIRSCRIAALIVEVATCPRAA